MSSVEDSKRASGIKILHGFDINKGQTTELILDFDASRSIVKAGSSGKWLLKPTIKVLDTEEYSVISGTVRNNSEEPPGTMRGEVSIDGGDGEKYVTVSIRQSAECDDNIDQIEVKSLNVANGGDYDISLPVATYTVVASSYDDDTQIDDDVEIMADSDTTTDIVFA